MNKIAKIFMFIFILTAVCCGAFFIYYYHKNNSNFDVNILFNTDKNYKEYTKVAIKSAIENKKPESIYHINILCVDIPQNECDEFYSLKKNNVEIKVLPANKKTLENIGNYEIFHYVTRTDLFKFLFSELFKDDKMLYIDSDTLILKDLRNLYNTDISKYYLGAVMKLEPDKVYDPETDEEKDVRFYNCGVLLLNLKKFREKNISYNLINTKNEDEYKDYQTQRVFNTLITLDEIKVLSPIYNNIGRWNDEYIKDYNYTKDYFPFSLKYPTIKTLDKNSVIIHYSGTDKPWIGGKVKYAGKWWKYARMINPDWKPEKIRYEKKMSKE